MKRLLRLGVVGLLVLPLVGVSAFSAGPATAAPACQSGTPAPSDPYPGTTNAATNFESGTLSPFTPFTAGTGTASVSSASSHSPNCAAFLHATTASGSIAKMSVGLTSGMKESYADGWFNIATQGVSGNDNPYFRFFSAGTRYLDVFRENISGKLELRQTSPNGTFVYTLLGPTVALGTWHHLVMHVVPNGATTGVQIWWDDQSIFSSTTINISATSFDAVQLGAEHPTQMGDIYADDVVINSGSETPGPIPGPLPTGTPPTPGTFVPIAPTRFLDTRNTAPVGADSGVSFQVGGVSGIPAKVSAVVFNMTVTQPKSFGFITAYPSGTARPNASNENFAAGQTVPNSVTVPVGADGKVTLFNRSSGTTHLIADVAGYYIAGTPTVPGAFAPRTPSRFLDTRSTAPAGADAAVSFQVGGTSGIPTNVSAVVFNMTVTQPQSFGFITAYPSGTARPNASNENFAAGQTVPNSVTVSVGGDGKVALFNRSSGTTHLIADVAGYFLSGTP